VRTARLVALRVGHSYDAVDYSSVLKRRNLKLKFAGQVCKAMSPFLSSLLANFFGSLLAGMVLALAGYFLITRKYQIVQPRQERIKEAILVCSLLIDELQDGKEFAESYLAGKPKEERLQMHAWDALKGSQAVRFLPIVCLEPILKAYSDLHVLEFLFRREEDAQLRDWETGNTGVSSGAVRLGKMIAKGVSNRLSRSQQNCAHAIRTLTGERERLKASLGIGG
jgi:hypothetical protein